MREKMLPIRDCHATPLDLAKATPFELFAVYCFLPDRPGVAYLGPEIA